MSGYFLLNTDFVKCGQAVFSTDNRAFLYGDSLFETMHAYNGKIQLIEEHFFRLTEGLKYFKYQIPAHFTVHFLASQVELLLSKNRIYKGARIRLTVFRNSGGFYAPTDPSFSYTIEATELNSPYYKSLEKGLFINIFDDVRKPVTEWGFFKTGNCLPMVLAAASCRENNVDDTLLLNNQGCVVEATSSNIFIVKKNLIYTPPLTDGCVMGVMRGKIISLALKNNFEVFDQISIKPEHLEFADEIFLTNAVAGIKWVVGLGEQRYYNTVSSELVQLLNRNVFE